MTIFGAVSSLLGGSLGDMCNPKSKLQLKTSGFVIIATRKLKELRPLQRHLRKAKNDEAIVQVK
jgi:hypothetical protein